MKINKNLENSDFWSATDSMVRRNTHPFCRDYDLAEDVAQDVLLALFLGNYKVNSKGQIVAFIREMIKNACIDAKRNKHNDSRKVNSKDVMDIGAETFALEGENPIDLVEKRELAATIKEGLKKLPKNVQKSMNFFHLSGYKIREIAELMKYDERTIKRWLKRGKSEIGRFLVTKK